MKLGIVSLWRDSLDAFIEEIELAESLGIHLVGVGDSQSGYRELYVSLAVAASHSRHTLLGPMVTNPITRHPSVTASAIGSIDRLSGGRAVLGLGTGGSAVWTAGRPPARVAELREYTVAVKDLLATGEATFRDDAIQVQGLNRAVPIFVSAEGPRTLALAGGLADAVVLHSGTSPEAIRWCRDHIAAGARAAGRNPGEIEIWMMLKAGVADDRPSALAEVRAGLAGSASHALRRGAAEKGVPPQLLGPVAELIGRYDAAQHGVTGSANADLVESLGLTDFLAGYFGLVGTPADCAHTIDELSSLGVDGIVCPASSANPLELIERLGGEVLPLVNSRRPA